LNNHERDKMENLQGVPGMSRQEDQVQWRNALPELQAEKPRLRIPREGSQSPAQDQAANSRI
jgi:hypothetical protein